MWLVSVAVQCFWMRTSCIMMLLSLEPVASDVPFQASAPTRAECPRSVRTCFRRDTSQICTSAAFVPTAMCLPSAPHCTLVT